MSHKHFEGETTGAWITFALVIAALVLLTMLVNGCGISEETTFPELEEPLTTKHLFGVWENASETLVFHQNMTFRRVTPVETWNGTWEIVDSDMGAVTLWIESYETNGGIYTPRRADELTVLMKMENDRLTVEGVSYTRRQI